MTVTLIAVYTVVLVLLKDQWWYVLKLSGMNQEAIDVWVLSSLRCSLRTQVNRSQVPLEERSTWSNSAIVDLNQKPQSSSVSLDLNQATNPASACSPFKRSFLFQYKTSRKRVVTALCCWYSFPFHVILSKPVQSRRLLMWRRVNQPNEHKEDSRWWWDLISIASIRERPFVLDVPSTSYLCW